MRKRDNSNLDYQRKKLIKIAIKRNKWNLNNMYMKFLLTKVQIR